MFNSNHSIPILFFGDSPDSHTGLGRIGHDLAWLVSSMPEFKVGYLGRMAFGRAQFPWVQYSFGPHEQWGEQRLQEAWNDLSRGQKGIIFTLWDASRLLWFADGQGTGLEPFLKSGQFQRWGYFMCDGAGVNPLQLPFEQTHVLSQYNRVLTASQWACELAKASGISTADWLPHPINRSIFHRRGRDEIRSAWGLAESQALIGCVMTNQQRKSWPVVMEAVKLLSDSKPFPKFWIHTDSLTGYWNLQALAAEYGLLNQIVNDGRPLSDEELAMRYSACDVTAVISGGEGFCYPCAESLSCGTPCVTGVYGAQAELTHWTVFPAATMVDTSHSVRRAVYKPQDVANQIWSAIAMKPNPVDIMALVAHLNMAELGVMWKRWFSEGLK